MKSFRCFLLFVTILLCALLAIAHPILASFCALAVAGSQLAPQARLGTATLILPILTGKIIESFRTEVPELSFFSTDYGLNGGQFAQPAKYGQEVLSYMIQAPTVSNHTPGASLSAGASNVKDFLRDVRVKVDRCKKVVFKVPSADAVQLELDQSFQGVLSEAAIELGRAIVGDAIAEVTTDNFTQSITETLANTDYDTLNTGRIALNAKGAKRPRFGLGGSTFVGNIALDPRVASGDYHGQLTTDDPYQTLSNIQGFSAIREYPDFPTATTANNAVGTFTAATTDVITLAAHGLLAGDRLRFTTTGTLPAGLSLATTYYVIASGLGANTFKVSATLGGAAVDITDTGTGVHTANHYGSLTGFLFEKRAIHIAIRQMVDNLAMAERLGIPVPIAWHTETDGETGLTFTTYMWIDVDTHDIYCACVVMFGIKAGRAIEADSSTDPGSLAAGSGVDYGGLRVIGD